MNGKERPESQTKSCNGPFVKHLTTHGQIPVLLARRIFCHSFAAAAGRRVTKKSARLI